MYFTHGRQCELIDGCPRPRRLMKPNSEATHEHQGRDHAWTCAVSGDVGSACSRTYTHSTLTPRLYSYCMCTTSNKTFLVTAVKLWIHLLKELKSPVDTQSLCYVFYTIISYGITTEATEESTATVKPNQHDTLTTWWWYIQQGLEGCVGT